MDAHINPSITTDPPLNLRHAGSDEPPEKPQVQGLETTGLGYVMAGGAALMVAATRQGGARWLLALLGGGLVYRGVMELRSDAPLAASLPEPLDLQRTLSVCVPPDQAYALWRSPERVQSFLRHITSIEVIDEGRWRWRIQPLDAAPSVAWDMVLAEDVPGKTLRWASAPDAPVRASLALAFRAVPNSPMSEVQLSLSYNPGSHATSLLAHVLRPGLKHQVSEDLRRYKQLLETGEMATVEGQPAGQRSALHSLTKWVMA